MLKMTGIELEFISDIDMHLFIEKGMRGGVSYICKRHSLASNKYCFNCNKNMLLSFIGMQIFCIAGKCVSVYHMVDLNG